MGMTLPEQLDAATARQRAMDKARAMLDILELTEQERDYAERLAQQCWAALQQSRVWDDVNAGVVPPDVVPAVFAFCLCVAEEVAKSLPAEQHWRCMTVASGPSV